MASDRVYIDLWRSLGQAQARTHQSEAAQMRGQIVRLEQELADRPVKEVERYIGADEIQAHKDEADRAFRETLVVYSSAANVALIRPLYCTCDPWRLDIELLYQSATSATRCDRRGDGILFNH
jgi:hypothetical protein